MTYTFRWKRFFFWHSRRVVGHKYEDEQDKMCLYFPDGSLEEITDWTRCAAKLGTDWVLMVKAALEKEAGQAVPVNVGGA
jgi:hypothetical protein